MSLLHRILPFSPTRHFNEPVQTPRVHKRAQVCQLLKCADPVTNKNQGVLDQYFGIDQGTDHSRKYHNIP